MPIRALVMTPVAIVLTGTTTLAVVDSAMTDAMGHPVVTVNLLTVPKVDVAIVARLNVGVLEMIDVAEAATAHVPTDVMIAAADLTKTHRVRLQACSFM